MCACSEIDNTEIVRFPTWKKIVIFEVVSIYRLPIILAWKFWLYCRYMQSHSRQVYAEVKHHCFAQVSVLIIGLTPQVNLDIFP